MSMITVNGTKYIVVENLGFIHSRNAYGKVINFEGDERVVLKIGGEWTFAKPIIIPGGQPCGQ